MKKTLAIILALALLCTLAIGSTLSYFTDDDFDKNTMTVGNVLIDQKETFATNAPLRPYIGDPTQPENETDTEKRFDLAKNAVQKLVTVENIGSEAAYIRTLFAFEGVKYVGTDTYVNPLAHEEDTAPIIHVDYNTDTNVGAWAYMGSVKIGEVDYFVYSFTYSEAVPGYAVDAEDKKTTTTTAPSLKAIALDCAQGNAFSEAVGAGYDVLALSQAVQTAGFTGATAVADAFAAAFPLGEGNAIPATWFAQN